VNGSFVAFDLETTGLLAQVDRVVEVGAVRFAGSGGEISTFQSLVRPDRPMSPSARAVHGISDADLADAPGAAEVLPRFLDWLGEPSGSTLLAHNAAFDAGFLGRELARAGLPAAGWVVADTLALARSTWPGATSHRLERLSGRLGLDGSDAHRALADARRVRGVWLAAREAWKGSLPPLVSYRLYDPLRAEASPEGWAPLAEAAARGWVVRIEYEGGSRGPVPREITPRRFVHKGGIAYVVALCHMDAFEKSFRLDRVRRYEVLAASRA
jgi:DNA polymerase III epsilon subunit family exonuclease